MKNLSNNLGIYTRYDRLGASSRLRFCLYLDALREAGWQCAFHPFFPEQYLIKLYGGHGKSRTMALHALWNRLGETRRLEENLFIEYELLPFLPGGLELALLGRRKFVLNFDDDVWVKYGKFPLLRNKFDALCRRAAGVIGANELLVGRLQKLNARVLELPTPVDPARFDVAPEKFPRFTIAWIGTPVTYRACLLPLAPVLQQAATEIDFDLCVISNGDLPPIPGVHQRFEPWSIEREAELLRRCHIGIMPLGSDPFSAGKSAYKLIQYLAAGLPAVAAPVGENRRVLRDGVTGFLAGTDSEWLAALKRLAYDSSLRARMSEATREFAAPYTLPVCAAKLTQFLEGCFSADSK